MCKISKHTKKDKGEIIDALLHNNLFKMPDGRQFYEASEKELRQVLNSQQVPESPYPIY